MSFDIFDYPYAIVHIAVTEGHTDQDTGVFVAGSESEAPVTGHLQDVMMKDLKQYPEGAVEAGDRVFVTSALLDNGDKLRITEDNGSPTTWKVLTIDGTSHVLKNIIGVTRRTYLLKRA